VNGKCNLFKEEDWQPVRSVLLITTKFVFHRITLDIMFQSTCVQDISYIETQNTNITMIFHTELESIDHFIADQYKYVVIQEVHIIFERILNK
jgi:hypothetical protein